jgi:cytidylate kinase
MIITISGTPGSGKSTLAKAIAKEFNLKHYSTGDFSRELAEKRGISLLEIGTMAETDPSIDKELDDMTKNLRKKKDFVMDSRLAWHFLPNSLKIFVKCDPEVATKRIFKDALEGRRGSEPEIKSFDDALKLTKKRFESEMSRYKKYYDLDYTDESQYDIVIDTSNMTKEDSIKQSIDAVKKHLKKE